LHDEGLAGIVGDNTQRAIVTCRSHIRSYNALMAKRKTPAAEVDTPWKEALDYFLPRFLAFFFPKVHQGIDWRRGYEALDKEFQQIVREAASGRVLADKLYKVWRGDGQETWLLIHVEVQGQPDRGFARRMFD
jgi:hypothetical protein